jgi:ABC-2 type transport system ATP-binding protein
MSDSFAIQAEHLTKTFGKFIAVNDVSFEVRTGEVFGFLGANGSGKSTTIRMLCGLLQSTSGTARVAGFDINKNPEQVKAEIGYMSQKFSLYEDLTVNENISLWGGIYGLTKQTLEEKRKWVLEMASLKGRESRLPRDLPGGWRQRLALGCAMLHDPKVLFLDEPTGGVDPVMRRRFWDLILDLAERGTTVFVTTHYLDEAEYCHHIMLLHEGRIVAGGSPRELKERFMTRPVYEVETDNVVRAMTVLGDVAGAETSIFGTTLHVSTPDKSPDGIVAILNNQHIGVSRIEPITPTLEDVFLHVIDTSQKEPA